MRFSSSKKLAVTDLAQEREPVSSAELMSRVSGQVRSRKDRVGTLFLVGGTAPADLLVRQAQAHLRTDQLPSYWSHAAMILDWSGEPEDAVGAEVALDPIDPGRQVPERNGVTLFRMSRYLDDSRYPNFAVATLAFRGPKPTGRKKKAPKPPDPRKLLLEAALHPLRDRLRFPFLDWVGAWRAHTTAPFRYPNPSLGDVPHPGAAFCEYVLEKARVDITPGATAPNSCPETLWATLLYWHDQMAATGVEAKVWSLIRDPKAVAREPAEKSLEDELRSEIEAGRAT